MAGAVGDSPPLTTGTDRPDTAAEALLQATENLASTAKWIAAAFAAVGGALITGISFSDVGDLTGGDRRLAIFGAALGLFGVIGVIFFATRVLASRFVALDDFRGIEAVQRRPFWSNLNPAPKEETELGWALARLEKSRSLGTRRGERVIDFIDWLDEWNEELIWARRDGLSTENERQEAANVLKEAEDRVTAIEREEGTSAALDGARQALAAAKRDDDAAEALLKRAEHRLKKARGEISDFERLADRLRITAQYEFVKARFDTSRFWIGVGSGFAGIGVLLFALATGGSG